MEKSIGLRVTVEFDCPNMLSEQDFHDQFGSDPMAAYRFISDNMSDSASSFSSDERVISVRVLGDSLVIPENVKTVEKQWLCLGLTWVPVSEVLAGFCMHNLDMKGKCFKCEEQYIRKEG